MQYTISFWIFLLSYVLGTAAHCQEQNHITGRLTDVSGSPIYEAKVILKEISEGTITDKNHPFSLPNGNNGILTLETSFLATVPRPEEKSCNPSKLR